MIFDDVRIPLKDDNGNNYNINKFGLEFLEICEKYRVCRLLEALPIIHL